MPGSGTIPSRASAARPSGSTDHGLCSYGDVNDPLPVTGMAYVLHPDASSCGPFTLRCGVYFVTALAEPAQLPALAADPLVYLADITPNAVRRDLGQRHHETRTDSFQWVRVQNGSPFWRMEDLGLAHFR